MSVEGRPLAEKTFEVTGRELQLQHVKCTFAAAKWFKTANVLSEVTKLLLHPRRGQAVFAWTEAEKWLIHITSLERC